jgi:hypothetical protein
MKPRTLSLLACCSLALGVACVLAATPARAQATKIFVASFGNDANDGSRGAPKRNFQPAHDAVAAGGQIVVLDTAGYGALNINKSLAVTVPPGVNGFVTVTGNAKGIVINAAVSDRIALRGLVVEGGGSGNSGAIGIQTITAGSVAIEDCTVRNFSVGIYVLRNASTNVYVHNTVVRTCSTGLDLLTTGSGTDANALVVTVSDSRIDANSGFGVFADSGNNGNNSVDVTLIRCGLSANNTAIGSEFPTCIVRVNDCTITDNSTGAFVGSNGLILSRNDNTIESNNGGNDIATKYGAK